MKSSLTNNTVAPILGLNASREEHSLQNVSVVEGWERAAALFDPLRLRILERLGEPDSAAGLAKALGLPRQRVGYHVKELEKRGLLRHVGERRKGNCVERLVQATARHYVIAPEALGALGLEPAAVKDRFSSAYLVALANQAARDVLSLQDRAQQTGQRLATLTLDAEVRFASPAAQQAFAEDLTEAFTKLVGKHHDEQARAGRRFRFLIAGYPATARGEAQPGPARTGKEESSDA